MATCNAESDPLVQKKEESETGGENADDDGITMDIGESRPRSKFIVPSYRCMLRISPVCIASSFLKQPCTKNGFAS